MAKILITGATGYIGVHVVKRLHENGHSLRCIVRKTPCLLKELNVDLRLVRDFHALDISDWVDLMEGCDLVIHLAWVAGDSNYLNCENNLLFLETSLRMMRASSQSGIKRFVATGTCLEYENSPRALDITSPLTFHPLYTSCKRSLHQVAEAFYRQTQIEFAWYRIFFVYGGDNEPERKLYKKITECYRTNTPLIIPINDPIRDFIPVDVAASMICQKALASDGVGVHNICTGVGHSISQFARSIVGSSLKIIPNHELIDERPYIVGAP